jgi:hypothetical protein
MRAYYYADGRHMAIELHGGRGRGMVLVTGTRRTIGAKVMKEITE